MARQVAIVGAGMAGAACARMLADHGHRPVLLDEGEAAGGRLAQRRVGEALFDHGAQYIRARDPAFEARLAAWAAAGIAARWPAGDEPGRPAWCGVPSMRAPVEALLDGIELRSSRRVEGLCRDGNGWRLRIAGGEETEPFPTVVLAMPAPEALLALGEDAPAGWRTMLERVAIAPCWSLMAAFAEPPGGAPESLRPAAGPLVWIASQAGKPGRGPAHTWIAHARPAWSPGSAEDAAALLLEAVTEALGMALPPPVVLEAWRWPYALVERPLGCDFLLDRDRGLGICGDWCLGPRVEAAFLSGRRLGLALAG